LSGSQPRDLPHLPHAPGSNLHCACFYSGLSFFCFQLSLSMGAGRAQAV
jgi:hypothetical protein